jgi:hypothetical protein
LDSLFLSGGIIDVKLSKNRLHESAGPDRGGIAGGRWIVFLPAREDVHILWARVHFRLIYTQLIEIIFISFNGCIFTQKQLWFAPWFKYGERRPGIKLILG